MMLFLTVLLSLYVRSQMNKAYKIGREKIMEENFQEAIDLLIPLGDFKDCAEYVELARQSILYTEAFDLFSEESYEAALSIFERLGDFQDSKDIAQVARYQIEKEHRNRAEYEKACSCFENEDYEQAIAYFADIRDYEDSEQYLEICIDRLKRLERSNTLEAGIRFSCGVTQEGTVYFSGHRESGTEELALWKDIISISVMDEIVVGLKKDGQVVTAGQPLDYHLDTSMWRDIIDVSVGRSYIVGLKTDGTLVVDGRNDYGQLNTERWNNIVAITTSWGHTVGLDETGKIYIAGFGSDAQLSQVNADIENWKDIVSISAGGGVLEDGHTVALKRNGNVAALDNNTRGQCNVESWTNIVAISAGAFHTVGLKSDGTVVTTRNEDKQAISEWADIVAISAGFEYTLGLKADGNVVGVGYYMQGQREIENWHDIAVRKEWGHIFNNENWG